MKETRLKNILKPSVYEMVINKYIQFIRNGEKNKALGLKTIAYASIYPRLNEDGSNPWRDPNEFLREICRNDYVFNGFYKLIKMPNSHIFGIKIEKIKTKLL
jgi:hypothetical protein